MDVDPHTMTLPLHNRKRTTPKHPFPFHVTSKTRKRREKDEKERKMENERNMEKERNIEKKRDKWKKRER